MRMLIKGGRVIDPGNLDQVCDIFINDGIIAGIIEHDSQPIPFDQTTEQFLIEGEAVAIDTVIDAAGKIITPGLVDMHVHFREPGFEYKETIETGCRAAAAGGFCAVCTMPNTRPVTDCPEVIHNILQKAGHSCGVRVYPVAAISLGLKGETLCDFEALKQAGAVAVSDDGNPVRNSRLMREALEQARKCGLAVISHSEDMDLAAGGVMNEGETAARLGLPGISNAAESIMILREIALSELTGAPVHIAHVSTRESVRAIRDAKRQGIPVTAETAPHYFTLTDAAVETCGSHAKMNPPLRTEADRQAILEGLADGTIDVIATDHAPHSVSEKSTDMMSAANGIIGLETSLSLGLKLVSTGVLTLSGLVEKMSKNPAIILGLENGIFTDALANLTLIDPDMSYTVDASQFQSKSRNTPFDGWELKGKAVMTIVGGKIVFRDRHFMS